MLHQVKALSRFYKRPLAAFFLPIPPSEPSLPHDFRTLPVESAVSLSSKTRLAMRQARRLQSIASELREETEGRSFSRPRSAKPSDDPEALAGLIREELGVSLEEQFSWKNDSEAMDRWKKSVESLGILVFQMSMPLEDARAFSLTDGGLPVIVVNTKDSPKARIFSLIHELGHILLNEGGICDPGILSGEDVFEKRSFSSIEAFCNLFSGAVLIPKDSLLNHRSVKGKKASYNWPERTLGTISSDFNVSKEVVLRRLLIAGLTTKEFYQKKHNEWAGKDNKKVTIKAIKRDVSRECLQRNGRPLTSLVLESYRNEKITTSDVADYLGIRVKHISHIEKLLEA